MVDYGAGSLKRGRNPPKAKSISEFSSSTLKDSSQAASTSVQVTPPIPYFFGVSGGKGSISGVLPASNEGSLVPALEFSSSPESTSAKGVCAKTCRVVVKIASDVWEDGVGSLKKGSIQPNSKGDSLCPFLEPTVDAGGASRGKEVLSMKGLRSSNRPRNLVRPSSWSSQASGSSGQSPATGGPSSSLVNDAGMLGHPSSLDIIGFDYISGGQTNVTKVALGHEGVIDTLKVALFSIDKTIVGEEQMEIGTQNDGLRVGTSKLY